jgi:hypothetical protein
MTPTPAAEIVRRWEAQWDAERGVHCDLSLYIAAKAAEWGYRQCDAEYERAAMDIYPPTDQEDDEAGD